MIQSAKILQTCNLIELKLCLYYVFIYILWRTENIKIVWKYKYFSFTTVKPVSVAGGWEPGAVSVWELEYCQKHSTAGAAGVDQVSAVLSAENKQTLVQSSPLSLVEFQRSSALNGRELQSVAKTAIFCHKEPVRASIDLSGSLWHKIAGASNSSEQSSTSSGKFYHFTSSIIQSYSVRYV